MTLSLILFFFFKQKTAYEMRISDWSSDVCSSDLRLHEVRRLCAAVGVAVGGCGWQGGKCRPRRVVLLPRSADGAECAHGGRDRLLRAACQRPRADPRVQTGHHGGGERPARQHRTEEHTSETQSLMRSTSAVCC